MIRATIITILTLTVTPAFAQEPIRIGAVSMAYVARASNTGKSALAEIEKFVKQKESEAAVKSAELEKRQLALQKSSIGLSARGR